jgi:hypothetical protein
MTTDAEGAVALHSVDTFVLSQASQEDMVWLVKRGITSAKIVALSQNWYSECCTDRF